MILPGIAKRSRSSFCFYLQLDRRILFHSAVFQISCNPNAWTYDQFSFLRNCCSSRFIFYDAAIYQTIPSLPCLKILARSFSPIRPVAFSCIMILPGIAKRSRSSFCFYLQFNRCILFHFAVFQILHNLYTGTGSYNHLSLSRDCCNSCFIFYDAAICQTVPAFPRFKALGLPFSPIRPVAFSCIMILPGIAKRSRSSFCFYLQLDRRILFHFAVFQILHDPYAGTGIYNQLTLSRDCCNSCFIFYDAAIHQTIPSLPCLKALGWPFSPIRPVAFSCIMILPGIAQCSSSSFCFYLQFDRCILFHFAVFQVLCNFNLFGSIDIYSAK